MGITESKYDYWNTKVSNFYGGLYYYALNNELEEVNNGDILGFVPTIQSAVFNPFFSVNDSVIYKIKFDMEYFGNLSEDDLNVYRIGDGEYKIRNLKTVDLFFNNPRIKKRDWRNESKLQTSPYTYYQLVDYFNKPLDIEPELCNDLQAKIKVGYCLSNRGGYNLYVEGYKNDIKGNVYGMVNESALDIPVLSSSYSQFLASSKYSFNTNLNNTIDTNNLAKRQNDVKTGLSLLNGVAGLLTNKNPKAITNTVTGTINSIVDNTLNNERLTLSNEQAVSSALSQVKDVYNSPRAVTSVGSDALFSMNNGDYKVQLIKYGMSNDWYDRLGTYFAHYGYKQNKFMDVNVRNRYYYNYMKTIDCNIVGSIPKDHLRKLKDIFNNGVTIWHIDRTGVNMHDYTYDNYEI